MGDKWICVKIRRPLKSGAFLLVSFSTNPTRVPSKKRTHPSMGGNEMNPHISWTASFPVIQESAYLEATHSSSGHTDRSEILSGGNYKWHLEIPEATRTRDGSSGHRG